MEQAIKNQTKRYLCNQFNLFTSAIKTVAFGKDGANSNSKKFIVK